MNTGSGTVTLKGFTKNQKPYVKIDGTAYYPARGLQGLPDQGKRIDFEWSSFKFQDGKEGRSLETYHILQDASVAAGNGAGQPISGDSEPVMRFISNCVGSAISAGTIKNPADIAAWVHGARNGLKAPIPLRTTVPPTFTRTSVGSESETNLGADEKAGYDPEVGF